MFKRSLIVFAAALMLTAIPCKAATIVLGPVPDFAGYLTTTASVVVNTSGSIHIPWDGNISWTDSITLRVTATVPIFVPSYARITVDIANNITAPVELYDIYAMDMNPGNPGTQLTGFNAANPEVIPLTGEIFTGYSGTHYSAPVQAVYLADLPEVFPGWDLSAFAQGNPLSIVYVSGPGYVPFSDIPEPGTVALAVLGAAGLLGRGQRFRSLR